MNEPTFTENSLRIFQLRYPRKDADGKPAETPVEVIQRVAHNVASVNALYASMMVSGSPRKPTHSMNFDDFPHRTARRQFEWLKGQKRIGGNFEGHMDRGGAHAASMARLYTDMIAKWEFLPNSPTWTGAGTPLGQLAACFVLPVADDLGRQRDSIFGTLNVAALIQQTGGGNGFSFGRLRPKDAIIKTSMGKATGPVGFMKTYDAAFGGIAQGGSRRGANMGVLPVSHPDIREFMLCKTVEGEIANFNISVALTDEFMQAVRDNKPFDLTHEGVVYETVDAKQLFREIAENAWIIGDPGNLFITRAHDSNPCPTRYEIEATNPCFHPDTMIETVHGPVRIADITEATEVLTKGPSGSIEVRKASASFVTRRDAETLTINLSNGRSLTVTPEHRIMLVDGTYVEAQALQPGDRVEALCQARRGIGYVGVKLASENNRAYRMKHRVIYEGVHGRIPAGFDINHIDRDYFNNDIDNFELLTHAEHARLTRSQVPNDHQVQGADGRFVTHPDSLRGRKEIRHLPGHLSSAWRNQPRVVSVEQGPITDVYDITVDETHNVIANFVVAHNCGEQYLGPYENCCLGSISVNKFVKSWFTIAPNGRLAEYGEMDWDRLAQTVRLATFFLDDVVDANQYVPAVPELENAAQSGRRIGLGLMGIADAMAMMGVRYGSQEGLDWLDQVTEFCRYHCVLASIDRSKARGPFPWIADSIYDYTLGEPGDEVTRDGVTYHLWAPPLSQSKRYAWSPERLDWGYLVDQLKRNGIRNSCQFTFAPTGTISNVAALEGSGLEPFFALAYIRTVMQEGENIRLNYLSPLLQECLRTLGASGEQIEAVLDYVHEHNGSLAGCNLVPQAVRHAFPVAADVTWGEHIGMQAAAQKWVDNSISKTINMPHEATVEDVEQAYLTAWELGCKGITIYRQGSRELEVLATAPVEEQVEEIAEAITTATPSVVWPLLRPVPQPENVRNNGLAARVFPVESFYGSVQVTITERDDSPGRPWDVRLQIGKGGNDTNAHVEALGRVISVALRTGVAVNDLVEQLINIGGQSSIGFGPQKVRSVADGVGKLLERLYLHGGRQNPGWVVENLAVPGIIEQLRITSYPPVNSNTMADGHHTMSIAGTVGTFSNATTMVSTSATMSGVEICPNCHNATVIFESGCRHCDPRLGGCGDYSGCD